MHIESTASHAVLSNGDVAIDAAVREGVLSITLSALHDGNGTAILTRAGANKTAEPLQVELPENATLEVHELSDSAILVICGRVADAEHSIALRLYNDDPWVEVAEVYACDGEPPRPAVEWFEAVWRFVDWVEPGEVFSPVLVPEEGDVVGRHVMRSPALVAQCGGRAAALVNDVDAIGRAQAMPACMNLLRDGQTPVFRTGLRPHRVRGHVFYQFQSNPQRPERQHHSYHLYVAADAPAGAALEAASRHCWERWGARSARGASSLPMAWEDYARQVYPRVIEQRWVETQLNGQRIGAITINRSYPHDVWMCPWFSQARSAYGLYLWGKWLDNRDWMERALATRDLHLAARQEAGLFPTVFVFGRDGGPCRWVHSHHQGGGPEIYHLFDMSWTVYQLLRWHRDIVQDAGTLAFARHYSDGVLCLQATDGSLPAYVDADTRRPVSKVDPQRLLADLKAHPGGDGYLLWGVEKGWSAERFVNSAEDSATLLCLAELARLLPADDPDRARFIAGARRIADWMERAVFPDARWIDFEVYYSCSAKPLDFTDRRSGQGPQNTLCMHTAAAGLLALYELTVGAGFPRPGRRETGRDKTGRGNPAPTGEAQRYLDLARRALARMSLYQQVWDPPFLNFHGFGGYGVMNTDGEWSDARQGQFADTHLDFYRALGEPEQLQRAQAACRAGLATVFLPGSAAWYPTGWNRRPMGLAAENHAHSGSDHLCGASSFDWGSGSALATAAYLRLHHALE